MTVPVAHTLSVEGIRYLRAGRHELAAEASAALDAGDERRALALLLTDRDDWAPGAPISVEAADEVIELVERGGSLRDAMAGLGYGRVADYFAHRWSDPTYLSGLALLQEAWPEGRSRPNVVELACGIGQLLRAADDVGAAVTGIDVVFSKLWLARRFVVPGATLICADLERAPLPFGDSSADLVVIHDALYFLAAKQHVVAEARRVGGTLAVGHAHNGLVDNLSAGHPLDPAGWAALLPGSRCFDDLELTAAWLEDRPARPSTPDDLAGAAAVALVTDDDGGPRPRLGWPPAGRSLRLNPLLRPGHGDPVTLDVRWPSDRYRDEYAEVSAYLDHRAVPADLLERAGAGRSDDPDVAELVRRRIVLDLPERW